MSQHLAGCEACNTEAHVSPRVVKREVVSTRDGGGALSFACPNILFMLLTEKVDALLHVCSGWSGLELALVYQYGVYGVYDLAYTASLGYCWNGAQCPRG